MCTLPLYYSNDSQKCEWKITNTKQKQTEKKEGKKLHFENAKLVSHNIHNPCDLPKFYDFLATLKRRTTHEVYQVLNYLELFVEAGSKLVQLCTKFKVMWVFLLLRNVQVCEFWYCAAYQCSKVIGFIKNFKRVYGYWGFINSLPRHQTIY